MGIEIGHDEVHSLDVETSPDGQVLLVMRFADAQHPAVLGFGPDEADRFGKRLREAAREARFMRKVAANG